MNNGPQLVPMTVDAGAATVEVAVPEGATRTLSSLGDAAHDWLCAWCHHAVASEKDRLEIEGRSEFTFRNPEGIRFEILTFSRAPGCGGSGVPTLEHTWFPGHAWSFCQCDDCRSHLGWFYVGPTEFCGLIRERIVRASVIRN